MINYTDWQSFEIASTILDIIKHAFHGFCCVVPWAVSFGGLGFGRSPGDQLRKDGDVTGWCPAPLGQRVGASWWPGDIGWLGDWGLDFFLGGQATCWLKMIKFGCSMLYDVVCMFLHTYIYIEIYRYRYIYTYTYTHTHIYIYMQPYMCFGTGSAFHWMSPHECGWCAWFNSFRCSISFFNPHCMLSPRDAIAAGAFLNDDRKRKGFSPQCV